MFPLDAQVVPLETQECLLTEEAVEFLRALHRRFQPSRQELLAERARRQEQFDLEQFDLGNVPGLLPAGTHAPLRDPRGELHPELVTDGLDWTVAPPPAGLAGGPLLVVGPPQWNALSRGLDSGAKAVVADFDDHASHTWTSCLEGHANLRDLLGRNRENLSLRPPSLFVRPRNWSLVEKHFPAQETPLSASLFDFGLYAFHAAAVAGKAGLCFSLPKLEDSREARLWKEIFVFSEDRFGLSRGSIRAIVTIETVSAAFEMEEILFELREHACALECSPLNYLSSFAGTFRACGEFLLPQRADITMDQPFLRAYRELLVYTCRKRGALSLSAGLAQWLAHDDWRKNQWAMAKLRLGARQEIEMGFDGVSVSDSELVPVVRSVFQNHWRRTSPADPKGWQCYITPGDLISRAHGEITMAGLSENVALALDYLEAWLGGHGCVRIADRMESMATAELCRTQLRQWIRHSARLQSGNRIDRQLVECLIRDRLVAIECSIGEAEFAASRFAIAADLLLHACTDGFDLPLAVRAYARLR